MWTNFRNKNQKYIFISRTIRTILLAGSWGTQGTGDARTQARGLRREDAGARTQARKRLGFEDVIKTNNTWFLRWIFKYNFWCFRERYYIIGEFVGRQAADDFQCWWFGLICFLAHFAAKALGTWMIASTQEDLKCIWHKRIISAYLERPFKIQKNGVFLFEISLFRFKDIDVRFSIMQIDQWWCHNTATEKWQKLYE